MANEFIERKVTNTQSLCITSDLSNNKNFREFKRFVLRNDEVSSSIFFCVALHFSCYSLCHLNIRTKITTIVCCLVKRFPITFMTCLAILTVFSPSNKQIKFIQKKTQISK